MSISLELLLITITNTEVKNRITVEIHHKELMGSLVFWVFAFIFSSELLKSYNFF